MGMNPMVTNTRPAPPAHQRPYKIHPAVCKSPGGSRAALPARNTQVEDTREPPIPDLYKDLADITSPMFDPLTCIKNGIKVSALEKEKKAGYGRTPAEAIAAYHKLNKIRDKGLTFGEGI